MKRFTSILTGLALMLFLGALSGCGGSDNDPAPAPAPELDNRLFGTWTGVWESDDCDDTQDITLSSDGTFTYYENKFCDDGDTTGSQQGTWHTKNDRLYVTITDAQGSFEDAELNREFSMLYVVSSDGNALAVIDEEDLVKNALVMIDSDGGIIGQWQSQEEGDCGLATLTINDDQTWSIADGCKSSSGTYNLDGNMITLSLEGGEGELFGIYMIINSTLYIEFETDGLLFKD